jgi:hypothetical protein
MVDSAVRVPPAVSGLDVNAHSSRGSDSAGTALLCQRLLVKKSGNITSENDVNNTDSTTGEGQPQVTDVLQVRCSVLRGRQVRVRAHNLELEICQ